jgi:hypothetical protein
MDFTQPAAQSVDEGERFVVSNYIGALLLIYPREFEAKVETVNGPRDVVKADIVVLDGPDSPQVHVNTWLFGAVLTPQLKPSVGAGPVLARLGLGLKQPGKNAPHVLESFTAQDSAAASAYLQKHPDPFAEPVSFAAPATVSGLSAPGATPPAPAASTPINTDDPAVVALLAQLAQQKAAAGAPPF